MAWPGWWRKAPGGSWTGGHPILTGRYPGNAGVRAILAGHRTATGLPQRVPTLATALKKEGGSDSRARLRAIESRSRDESAPAGYVEPGFDDILAEFAAAGFRIADETLQRFHVSLKTRGFVILWCLAIVVVVVAVLEVFAVRGLAQRGA